MTHFTIETTARCPVGFVAAVAVEHLGADYDLVVREDGYFLAHHGGPGPRVIAREADPEPMATAEDDRLGHAAMGGMLARCLAARDVSPATHVVAEHVLGRVGPSFASVARAAADARPAARAHARDALGTLDDLVAAVPRADWEGGTLVSILAAVARWFQAYPEDRDARPALARRIDEISASPAFQRACARIARGA